jgi:hypothetical protein
MSPISMTLTWQMKLACYVDDAANTELLTSQTLEVLRSQVSCVADDADVAGNVLLPNPRPR